MIQERIPPVQTAEIFEKELIEGLRAAERVLQGRLAEYLHSFRLHSMGIVYFKMSEGTKVKLCIEAEKIIRIFDDWQSEQDRI